MLNESCSTSVFGAGRHARPLTNKDQRHVIMSTEIDLEEVNPYEGHLELTKLEAEVLWEYAKLAKNVKNVRDTLRDASSKAHN